MKAASEKQSEMIRNAEEDRDICPGLLPHL